MDRIRAATLLRNYSQICLRRAEALEDELKALGLDWDDETGQRCKRWNQLHEEAEQAAEWLEGPGRLQ